MDFRPRPWRDYGCGSGSGAGTERGRLSPSPYCVPFQGVLSYSLIIIPSTIFPQFWQYTNAVSFLPNISISSFHSSKQLGQSNLQILYISMFYPSKLNCFFFLLLASLARLKQVITISAISI